MTLVTRLGMMAGCAAMGCAAGLQGGCSDRSSTTKPAPETRQIAMAMQDCPVIPNMDKSHSKVGGKRGWATTAYFNMFLPAGMQITTTTKDWEGRWEDKDLACPDTDACPKAIEFNVPHRNEGSDFCQFSVIRGPKYTGAGTIVIAKDGPEIEDGAGVYQATVGYAICGGNWPCVRGRRSRAGAPGTQFALELDKAGDTEWYYLLNTKGTHSVRVCGGDAGWIDCQTLTTPDSYIEVDKNCKVTVLPLAKAPQARKDFAAKAMKIAEDCQLRGADPKFLVWFERMEKESWRSFLAP